MSVLSRISSFSRLPKCCVQRHTTIRGFKIKKKEIPVEVKLKSGPKDVKLEPPTDSQGHQFSSISKHVLYTALVVPAAFTGGVIWQYEEVRKRRKNPANQRQYKDGNIRDHFNAMWNNISGQKKVAIGIISANVAVFLLWRIPSLTPFMTRYFMCCPTRGHSVVASTLSAFSHQSGLHLFVNMYVFWSFTNLISRFIGKEEVLAFYLAAGTFSGLTSSILKFLRRSPTPSVGASGAIMGILAVCCSQVPDARLQIAIIGDFIPHSFKASSALTGIVLFDCAGVIMKWHVFDHAGHLGGVFFGLAYVYLMKSGLMARFKWKVLDSWHKLRK